MTAYSWKSVVSADWNTAGDWNPSGPPNAATADATIGVSGVYTVTIGATESFLVDSLTFGPGASGVLALNGTLTLGGTLGTMTLSSGTVKLAGTINGGTVVATGGVLDATSSGVINSAAIVYGGGTVTVASGKVLTLAGVTTLDSGAEITGPGTLATTGNTNVIGTPDLDGTLIWDNTGIVLAGAEITTGYPSSTGKVTIANQAGGNFDLTADGQALSVYASSTLALSNAGTLAKTCGTGTSNISYALTNTGTLTATSGTLELDGGGSLGGVVTETTTGAVALGEGLFTLTGTVNGPGTLTNDGFYAFSVFNASTATFTNAGLIEKTAGTGIAFFNAALTNTGTITASSGTLDLVGGGLLGGVIGATGAGEIAFGSGMFTQAGATQTITGPLWLDGGIADVASTRTLTLTRAVLWGAADLVGPGILATTGTTTIGGNLV